MPLYEYQCTACGHRFELIRKFSDPPLEACPACGGVVTKLISSPAFQFKGSGFYANDYARKSEAPKADAGGTSDAKESSAKDGKETKDTSAKEPAAKESTPKEPAVGGSTTKESKTADSAPTPKIP